MLDDELPCLCIANGLLPSGHERGEPCPSWHIFLYGNAYGVITERDEEGYYKHIEWQDPQDVIIKWKDHPPPMTDKKYDTRTRRIVRYMLEPLRLVLGLPAGWLYSEINYHHVTAATFWTGYACWFVGCFIAFWLREGYTWAGGNTGK